MADPKKTFRAGVLSVVKHDYLPRAVAAHPRFELLVVADDAAQPDWVHERNQLCADEFGIPYVRDVAKAIAEHDLDLATVSSEAERHCDLAVRAADAGLHVIADKPMSTRLSECDRLVEAVQRNNIKFLLWNRNYFPAVIQAKEAVRSGAIGELQAVHVDFYFSKDAGPAKGSRQPGDPPINWLERQIEAHADGSDGGAGTEIDFFIDFEFRSRLLQMVATTVFNEAVRRMVGAFEIRADAIYGQPPPEAVLSDPA